MSTTELEKISDMDIAQHLERVDAVKGFARHDAQLRLLKAADDNVIRGVVTTSDIDRDGEVVLPKGIDLSQFKDNPVLMFFHNLPGRVTNEALLPIGQAQSIRFSRDEDGLVARFLFSPLQFAQDILTLFKGGFMRAFSIGATPFMPDGTSDFGIPTKEEIKKFGKGLRSIIRRSLLLEISAVPMGSNPKALKKAFVSRVCKSGEARTLLERLIEEGHGDDLDDVLAAQVPGPMTDPSGGSGTDTRKPKIVKVNRIPEITLLSEPEAAPAVTQGPKIIRKGVDIDWLVDVQTRIRRGAVIKVRKG